MTDKKIITARPLSARASKATMERKYDFEEDMVSPPEIGSPVRFSIRRDMEKEGSPLFRIIGFGVVVVAVGVGLLFLVQNVISNQNQGAATTSSSATSSSLSAIDMPSVAKADDSVSDITPNSLFTTSPLSLGTSLAAGTTITLASVEHNAYNSFTRTLMTLDGVTNSLPATTISYNADAKQILITLAKVTVTDATLLEPATTSIGNVKEIAVTQDGDATRVVFTLAESGKYYASVHNGKVLTLDVKSDSQLNQSVTTTSSASTTSMTSSASTSAAASSSRASSSATSSVAGGIPSAPHYDNTASQSKQYVVSNVTDNSVLSETYYYVDYGDSFQFSWAMRGTGDASIPNATAELIQDNGKNYVEVVMSNLGFDLLGSQNRNPTINVTLAGSNVVQILQKGYSGGKATYWVELKQAGNFRLHSTLTYNNRQLLSIQIMD